MSGIITKATEWEILPETFANPIQRVKLPRKWEVREKRILSPEETARVMARIEEPNCLICDTCLDTGTRISDVTGLMIKHFDFEKGIIKIEQRNWHGDIDVPKTAKSRRTLALGGLAARYKAWIAGLKHQGPNAWVFPKEGRPGPASLGLRRPQGAQGGGGSGEDRFPRLRAPTHSGVPTSRGGRRLAAAASRRARSRATRAQPLRRSTRWSACTARTS